MAKYIARIRTALGDTIWGDHIDAEYAMDAKREAERLFLAPVEDVCRKESPEFVASMERTRDAAIRDGYTVVVRRI